MPLSTQGYECSVHILFDSNIPVRIPLDVQSLCCTVSPGPYTHLRKAPFLGLGQSGAVVSIPLTGFLVESKESNDVNYI